MGNLNQFSKDNRAAKASRSVSKPKDVIYDPMGQWKYPGQVTKIPSGDITMQGVPYPVYGVDNLGNSQMMLPNMDYTFPGNTVTEYPMAQKGRIVKTKAYGGDPSLPNITGHYPFGGQYTKTHTHMAEGGWLDKYQIKGAVQTMPASSTAVNKQPFVFPDQIEKNKQEALAKREAEIRSGKGKESFLGLFDIPVTYSPLEQQNAARLAEAKLASEQKQPEVYRNLLDLGTLAAGTGLLSKTKNVPASAIKAINKESKLGDKLSGATKNIKDVYQEVVGEFKQGKANREAIKEGNKWLKEWIEHPATQQKIDKSIDDRLAFFKENKDKGLFSEEDYNKIVDNYELLRSQAKNFNPATTEFSLLSQIFNLRNRPMHLGNLGVSYLHQADPALRQILKPNKVTSYVSRKVKYPQEYRTSTTIHEGTHDWASEWAFRNAGLRNLAIKDMSPAVKKDFLEWESLFKQGLDPKAVMGKERAYKGYLADPTEQHARIMEIRKEIGATPDYVMNDKIAEEVVNWIQQRGSKIDPKFLDVIDYDPKKFKNLFNNFWAITPAVGTGALMYNQQPQQKKFGGWLDKYQGGGSYEGEDGKVYLDPTVYGSSKNPIAAGRPSDQRTPDLDTAWAYKNSAKASEPVVVRDPDMSLIPKIEARPIKEAVIEPVPLIKKQEAILTKEPVVESSAEKPVVKPTVKPVVKSTTPPVSTKPIVKPVPKKVAPVTKDNSVTSSKPINKTLPIQKPLTPNTPIKDRRQIPKTGVVVDKRTNQLYYFGDKDKGTFPVLTGKNPNLNYNPYGITFLESHPNLRNTPVGYYLIGQQETDKPNIKDMIMLDDIGNIIGGPGSYLDYLNKSYNGKYRDILPINAFGVNAPVAVNVGLHRSYAKNAKNPNDAEFKKRDKLYQCGPNQRWTSYGCINVQDLAYDKLYKAFPKSDTLLVLDSNRPNDLRLLNQAKAKLGQKKYGGTIEWLSKYE